MKIICFIMAILFLTLTGVSLANIFIEWDGCKSCEKSGAAEVSSRIKSIFLTIVLGICTGTWLYLLIYHILYVRYLKQEREMREEMYKINMKNSVERNT